MAYFASPFYQGVLSLDHSHRPSPIESSYRTDFRNIADRLRLLQHQDKRTKDATAAQIKQRNKAACFHDACPSHKTIYQIDFISPDDKLTFVKKSNIGMDIFTKQDEDKGKLWENKHSTSFVDNESKVFNEDSAVDIKRQSTAVPKWKIDGWRDKQACWLRPLEERRKYTPDLRLYPH